MLADACYELAPHADSSAQARMLARSWASGLDRDDVFSLELVVSELVTNAIRHGAGTITLMLSDTAQGIRVGVRDHGFGRPVPRDATVRAPSGRGLRLIERLSSDWGVEQNPAGEGKIVWAVVATSSLRAQTAAG